MVPRLVKTVPGMSWLAAVVRFRTPEAAMVNAPFRVPDCQFRTPATVFVPAKVEPAKVRLVIVPPWNAGPNVIVPPARFNPATVSFSMVMLPPVKANVPPPVRAGRAAIE